MNWMRLLSVLVLIHGLLSCHKMLKHEEKINLPSMPRFDVVDLTQTKSPCVDLNEFVNRKWLDAHPVPNDKTTWGSFEMLQERTLAVQKRIVEAAANSNPALGSKEQKIGTLYSLGMNEKKLNEEGKLPLSKYLSEINALSSPSELVDFLIKKFAQGQQYVFSFSAVPDFKDANRVIGFAFQGGLSLPEKAYYEEDKYKDKRDAFVAHVEKMLTLLEGGSDLKESAKSVLDFETRLAAASLSRVDLRQPENQYNFVSMDEAEKATPNFSWKKLFGALNIQGEKGFSLSQPKFFSELNKMLVDVPLAHWKSYLKYGLVARASKFLSDDLDDEVFAFYGTTMRGQKEKKPRYKRVLDTINEVAGEVLGELYVNQEFSSESKKQMMQLVQNLSEVLKTRLENLVWMSASTKSKALEKWKTFTPKIGYPDKWRDYSGLTIDPKGTYYSNVITSQAFENEYEMGKIGKPTDKQEWGMTPQTVNAYYSPLKNEIVFPAAILQSPFFDKDADAALNYGGIGAVIGHEMLHGYDDQGSKFDHLGNNKNWWTEQDRGMFDARTAKLIKQFDSYIAVEDPKEGKLNVNGKLTLGENIADLGGLTVAYDALQKHLATNPVGKIDGYTQEQRFFMNWATVWRRNFTPDELKVRLNTDPHAPANFRANGAPSNMQSFMEAFQCTSTDPMVRNGEQKVEIW